MEETMGLQLKSKLNKINFNYLKLIVALWIVFNFFSIKAPKVP